MSFARAGRQRGPILPLLEQLQIMRALTGRTRTGRGHQLHLDPRWMLQTIESHILRPKPPPQRAGISCIAQG